MVKKTAALLATALTTILVFVGAGTASAAPSVYLGGGSGIVILQNGDKGEACTLTTIGKDSTNRLVGLTAGHCGNVGQLVFSERYANQGPVGRIVISNNNLDFAVIAFDPAKVAPVRSVRGVTIRSIQTAAPQFPAVLCKTGRTTGRTCGVTFFSDNQNHYSAICVAEGDSGSPVVVGDRLVGMVNAYFFTACIGPETGSNIGPILAAMNAAGVQGYRVI